MNTQYLSREEKIALLAIIALAGAARLIIIPFSTADGSNATARIWIAWDWLSNPEIITHGVWGPLHFYLIAFSMAIVEDPIYPPIVLHIAFAVLTPILVYIFTKNEIGSQRAALLVAATYALYPIAIRNSVQARPETPFVFFLLLSMIFLSLARRDDGKWRHVVAAGIFQTLASMLRYEGWMLIPLFGLLLWKKPRFMIIFGVLAMAHPVFWMIGNAIHYGDPLYSMTYAWHWELNSMGKSQYSHDLFAIIRRALIFPKRIIVGVTVLISMLCGVGAVICVIKREKVAIWLVPFIGLVCLMSAAVVRGSLVPKFNYTATLGTMVFPFAAVVYKQLGIDIWSRQKSMLAVLAMCSSVLIFSCSACLYRYSTILGDLTVSPIPKIKNQTTALSLPPAINSALESDDDGFVSDFYGWGASLHVPLLVRLPKDRVFWAPGAPNVSLDSDALSNFVNKHPRGALLIKTGSRFAKAIDLEDSGQAKVGAKLLSLKKIHSVKWPESGVSSKGDATAPQLEIYRYQAVDRR